MKGKYQRATVGPLRADQGDRATVTLHGPINVIDDDLFHPRFVIGPLCIKVNTRICSFFSSVQTTSLSSLSLYTLSTLSLYTHTRVHTHTACV